MVEFQPIIHVMHVHVQFQTLLRFYVKFNYRKRQESSKRKVSRFTGFHSIVEITLAGLALSVLKESRAQMIYQETFSSYQKSAKTTEIFSHSILSFTIFH